ncbi:MAG: hypothetical protein FJ270_03205 [Planctomycetes bacterium]|nr:hypothetical protein [Planctomycetota bacterium]
MMRRLAAIAMLTGACAGSTPIATDRPEFGDASSTPVAAPLDGIQRPGLLTMRWTVPEEGFVLDQTLATMEPCPDLAPIDHERLARSGLVVVRIPINELQHAVDILGGSYSDVRTWHEQALGWRDCVGQTASVRRVLVDGGVTQLDGRDVRLLVRGWVMPTHDGAVVHVEFTPAEAPDRRDTVRLGTTIDAADDAVREFRRAGASWTLRRGFVDVVTSCAPSAVGGTGPTTDLPLSIGEVLFAPDLATADSTPRALPRRTLLLLVPSLPPQLFPEAAPVASGTPSPSEP